MFGPGFEVKSYRFKEVWASFEDFFMVLHVVEDGCKEFFGS
jgi:hypothetical protein